MLLFRQDTSVLSLDTQAWSSKLGLQTQTHFLPPPPRILTPRGMTGDSKTLGFSFTATRLKVGEGAWPAELQTAGDTLSSQVQEILAPVGRGDEGSRGNKRQPTGLRPQPPRKWDQVLPQEGSGLYTGRGFNFSVINPQRTSTRDQERAETNCLAELSGVPRMPGHCATEFKATVSLRSASEMDSLAGLLILKLNYPVPLAHIHAPILYVCMHV